MGFGVAQLDFFGMDEDFHAVVRFVLAETDMLVYEAYSRPDEDIRRIASVADLRALADERKTGAGAGGLLLRGWSPAVTGDHAFRTFALDPRFGRQRTTLEGAGVMQFHQGRSAHGRLEVSRFSHWNEKGALQRCVPGAGQTDWPAMRRLSGRIQRHIRRRLAVAMAHKAAVLPRAHAAMGDGLVLWYGRAYGLADLEAVDAPTTGQASDQPARAT